MSKKAGVKVFAPASVANVAVGYDILGFAIENLGDEVIVREGSEPGLVINKIIKNKKLSKDINKNTAGYAAYKLLESLGLEKEPIEIDLIKNMAIGTGLGSSASSAVAGAYGVNAFLNFPYTKTEVLRFATLGEQIADGSFHADNVGPSLLGGFILIRDNESLEWTKIACPVGLTCVIIHPEIEILTKESRALLSQSVSLENLIKQSGNLGCFIASMYKSDFDLMRRSLHDIIIEPQRAHLIPEFYKIKEMALGHNAIGFSISGAGPSMFALCDNTFIAENIVEGAVKIYSDAGIECNTMISNINHEGAKKF
jgi:homoserine kinase